MKHHRPPSTYSGLYARRVRWARVVMIVVWISAIVVIGLTLGVGYHFIMKYW